MELAMPESLRIAVILANHDPAETPPTLNDCRQMMLTGPDSVMRYWADNTEGWFEFPLFDFFGPFTVAIPPPPSDRRTIIGAAKNAASAGGVNLAPYGSVVVLLFPGRLGGKGYDAGATAFGGGDVEIVTWENHTFFAHEMGHLLGLGHSYGIPNAGSDWSDDGIVQLDPVYGDPYDLMSSASFGDSNPTVTLPATVPGFPGSFSAGPMVSRAMLHYHTPAALESKGRVRHVYEAGHNEIFPLYPAGYWEGGCAELIVFHPANEDAGGRGRVYVEYRTNDPLSPRSRWDGGLTATGDGRTRRGVIVHVVKDASDGRTPVVHYAGRIVFPTVDSDVKVETPRGDAVVSVSQDVLDVGAPAYVRARVSRSAQPMVRIETEQEGSVVVTSTEARPIPGWDWAGEFSWERRETTRTIRYRPITAGLGGKSPSDRPTTTAIDWFLGNYMLTGTSGTQTVGLTGGGAANLDYSVDAATSVLTLKNHPADGSFSILVQASARDDVMWPDPLKANDVYEADGLEEGWGEDYVRFMDGLHLYHEKYPGIGILLTPGAEVEIRPSLAQIRKELLELRREAPQDAPRIQIALAHRLAIQPEMLL
jgi:hypothetical protein